MEMTTDWLLWVVVTLLFEFINSSILIKSTLQSGVQ
jgi:hypothetical protein